MQAELHALQAELQKRDAQIVQAQHDLASQVPGITLCCAILLVPAGSPIGTLHESRVI